VESPKLSCNPDWELVVGVGGLRFRGVLEKVKLRGVELEEEEGGSLEKVN